MKKARLLSVLFLSIVMMAACTKSGVDINLHDPQHIAFLDTIPSDLLKAFGEEHINFGHTPPSLDTIAFHIERRSLKYDTVDQIQFDAVTHQPIHSHKLMGSYDKIGYYHYFYNHINNIISDSVLYYGDEKFKMNYEVVYVIGSGESFTAYFVEKAHSQNHPTNGILISGTLVYTTDTLFINNDTIYNKRFCGIKDYRMGKEIIDYEQEPQLSDYLPLKGSFYISALEPTDTAKYFSPDTCVIWNQFH